jgi:NADH-quinone oxidoreductase subunit L
MPIFAGFWSKDEILAVTFARGGWHLGLWAVGIITALLTAFYMSRLMFLTFWGEPRWDEGVTPHESPAVMTMPLVALAGLATVGGLVNTPFRPALEHFLEPAFELVEQTHLPEGTTPWVLAAVSILAGVIGIGIAYRRYLGASLPVEEGATWDFVEQGYRVDDLYGATIVLPGKKASEALAFTVDAKGVDGAVNGVAKLVGGMSRMLRPLQTGYARTYGAGILVGAVGLVVWLLVIGGGL